MKKKKKKRFAEGFGPVYDSKGNPAPGYKGLGKPGKLKKVPSKKKIKFPNKVTPDKHRGKRYYA